MTVRSPTEAGDDVMAPRRLPRVEDFPESGPNALATIQQRAIARIGDELLVSIPVLLIQQYLGVGIDAGADVSEQARALALWIAAAVYLGQVLYEIVAVAVWGQTLGKWLTGIRVARYTDGTKPTWTQSMLRCLLWAAPGAAGLVFLGFSAIGAIPIFLSALRNPLRRGWHDEAGGTIVVCTR